VTVKMMPTPHCTGRRRAGLGLSWRSNPAPRKNIPSEAPARISTPPSPFGTRACKRVTGSPRARYRSLQARYGSPRVRRGRAGTRPTCAGDESTSRRTRYRSREARRGCAGVRSSRAGARSLAVQARYRRAATQSVTALSPTQRPASPFAATTNALRACGSPIHPCGSRPVASRSQQDCRSRPRRAARARFRPTAP
jgi:hypothetical protein